jgi:rsbT co-antagonist protein RsbR
MPNEEMTRASEANDARGLTRVDTIGDLRNAADRFRLVFERSPYGIIVFDTDYGVVDCNDALAAVLHSTRQRIVGLNFRRIPDQRIVPCVTEALAGRFASYTGEYRSATSGDEIIAVFRCSPVRNEHGNVIGGFGVVEDATDRIRTERHLREQLALVQRQAETIRRLGTPILKIWDEVLCLPIIGELDDARAAEVTEATLLAITRESARFVVLDLTGVDVVDTSTAHHLISLFRAAGLVGAEVLVSGIRPAVAQQIVMLDIGLTNVHTVQTLQDALKRCIQRLAFKR